MCVCAAWSAEYDTGFKLTLQNPDNFTVDVLSIIERKKYIEKITHLKMGRSDAIEGENFAHCPVA